MPKEDYLIKYLEKLSRAVAAMLGFRDKGFPEDAIRLADETYRELLNSNNEEILTMADDRFIKMIQKAGYSGTYIESMAQLTEQTADSYAELNENEKAQSFYSHALQLYDYLNEKDKTFSFEREMKISALKNKINS
jgi:hypothetical protein